VIDRKAFFDNVRGRLFGGLLTQAKVDGINRILDGWERSGLTDLRWLAYMLGTAYHETALTMQPIEEYGRGKGKLYGQPDATTKQTYYGRGLVQLTWLRNYEKAGRYLGLDLVNHPELALEPDNAVKILIWGMVSGWFTGKKLGDYFSATVEDWRGARRIINGVDCADQIAGHARKFYTALGTAPATGEVVV